VRLLLDTHILLWWLADDERLSKNASAMVADPMAEVYVSVVSLWEIAIKVGKGKLRTDLEEIAEQIALMDFRMLAVEAHHVSAYAKLPALHGDPFDRMLVAQAIAEPLRLLTHDRHLSPYSELVILV
jgi:PIN domain nuclease of toxin-antitoxin system